MARRRLPEFTDNHERWLISYADFLTLLFAFFVVMYSTSAVNKGSFRVLSDSIIRAFGIPGMTMAGAGSGDFGARETALGMTDEEGAAIVRVPLLAAANDFKPQPLTTIETSDAAALAQLAGIEQSLQSTANDLLAPDGLALTPDGKWLEIKIPASVLFPSGSRALLADSKPLLVRLAQALRDLPNEVVVQGHTDDQPIRNGLFPSNWELSTARAAAIVRVLEEEGVSGARLSAQGYAATRPVAGNDSEEGRAENRRVVLMVRNLMRSPEGPNNG